MATRKSHASLSSDPDFLVEYIDNLPDESDSNEEFEGHLGPDDGPVTYCNDHYPEDYDCYSDILTRSRSLDSLTEIEREREQLHSTESPLHGVSPSLTVRTVIHPSFRPWETWVLSRLYLSACSMRATTIFLSEVLSLE